MKKLYITLLVVILIGIFFDHNRNALSYTSGAPTGYTNAPGESSCSDWACHNSLPNTGTGGAMLVSMDDISNGYIPGNTYDIMPYVSQDGSVKIGFQTVALLSNGQGAGSVMISSSKTQMNSDNGKEYVTHSVTGTTGVLLMDWDYEWTAPPQGSGTVTIYGAFIASNNNMAASGDSIYTDSLVIPENTTGIMENVEESGWIVFPNPVTSALTLGWSKKGTAHDKYEVFIYNVFGEIVENETGSKPVFRFNLSNKPSGIYFIRIAFSGENKILRVIKI